MRKAEALCNYHPQHLLIEYSDLGDLRLPQFFARTGTANVSASFAESQKKTPNKSGPP
jgi:hypothetical protein